MLYYKYYIKLEKIYTNGSVPSVIADDPELGSSKTKVHN